MSITVPEIKGFVTRADAGLERPRSISKNISPQLGGVALHYGGWDVPTTNHASCIRRWKSWQDYHMGKNWSDIAYTMGVCQHGYAFAGRGAYVRTAGQGTNAGNNTHYAVCWIGGERQTVSDEALSAYAWCINELREAGNAGFSVKPHRHFKATGCPGNDVAAECRRVDGKIITEPTRNYITFGDSGSMVRSWQRSLLKWNPKALPDFGADADFGKETRKWTLHFMDDVKISVADRNRPRVGPRTLKAMDKALLPVPEPEPEPEPEPKKEVPNLLLTRIDNSDAVYHVSGTNLLVLNAPEQVEIMVRLAGLEGRWQDHVGNITAEEAKLFNIA